MDCFESNRLIYSKFIAEEYNHYHDLCSNEQVMHYITERSLTAVETRKRFDKILDINKNKGLPGVFIVRDKVSKVFVGLAKATIYAEGEIEIGYALMPQFWGKGMGSEVSEMMIAYSRNIPNVKTLVGLIDPSNGASKHILEKCGLTLFEEKLMDGLPGAVYKMIL